MGFSESSDTIALPDDGLPADPAALADQVRSRLGRRMIVVLLAPPDKPIGPAEPLSVLADMLAAFPAARVAYEQPPDDSAALETFLERLHSLGPDVVLVGAADETPKTSPAPDERLWHLRVFAIADRIGLCDRSFVALAGSRVTRQSARHAGFEDGFSLPAPVDALLPALVRETLARDEFRRKGSSPPCYL